METTLKNRSGNKEHVRRYLQNGGLSDVAKQLILILDESAGGELLLMEYNRPERTAARFLMVDFKYC